MAVGGAGSPVALAGGAGGGVSPRRTLPKACIGPGTGAPVTELTGGAGWDWAQAGGANVRNRNTIVRFMA